MDDLAGDNAALDGLWMSISDLAGVKGLSKQAVAERVAKFEAMGRLTTRPGKGRAKLVSLAAFDRAAGELTDLARAQGAATRRLPAIAPDTPPPPPALGADPVYTREQARKMAYAADLAKLDLDERMGRVVPVSELRDAIDGIAEELVRQFDQMPQFAEEISTAIAKDGEHGARVVLKSMALKMRTSIANGMDKLATKGRD